MTVVSFENIEKIYKAYNIPPHLQHHMQTVAGIGSAIAGHWISPKHKVDASLITQTLLLHDMGNIIKFDFTSKKFPQTQHSDFWISVQKKFIETYGKNEHNATLKIAREIEVSDKVVNCLQSMSRWREELSNDSSDWSLKIAVYSDFRVGPDGITSVDKRIDDLIERYNERESSFWSNVVEANNIRSDAKNLEKKIQNNIDIDLQNVADYV